MRVMIATTLTPSIVSEIASDRDHHGRLVPVVRADIDPLWSVGRPHLAPAAIVGGVDEGSAKERKAIEAVMEEAVMEAVMECGACETRRDCRICKARIRKARAVDLRACRAKSAFLRPLRRPALLFPCRPCRHRAFLPCPRQIRLGRKPVRREQVPCRAPRQPGSSGACGSS
jgi:hypothetical protein